MHYEVILPKKVQKELNKIDVRFQEKIIEALTVLGAKPKLGKRLAGEYKQLYSLRVWPFRIIYSIDHGKLIVLVIKIGHRQGVYK